MKRLFAAFILFLGFANQAKADKYYCLLFAYDCRPVPQPFKSHTFGTFIKIADDGKVTEEINISWEPVKISFIDRSMPGYSTSLKESLDYAAQRSRQICLWGPFSITEEFFEKAKKQHTTPGNYKFFDCCSRQHSQNCIHRLSDIAGPLKTGVYWGWWAADSVYRHYRSYGVIFDTDQGETIVNTLGINKYTIIYVTSSKNVTP